MRLRQIAKAGSLDYSSPLGNSVQAANQEGTQ
jgi:hypothetical protein